MTPYIQAPVHKTLLPVYKALEQVFTDTISEFNAANGGSLTDHFMDRLARRVNDAIENPDMWSNVRVEETVKRLINKELTELKGIVSSMAQNNIAANEKYIPHIQFVVLRVLIDESKK